MQSAVSTAIAPPATGDSSHHASFAALSLGALGVVFGDIGTSPLYTLRECLRDGDASRPEVLGILSLIVWSLMMVVTVKYLTFIMRADNRGEGGIFALLAIIPERYRVTSKKRISGVSLLVVAGAALLYGDGAITPAISVLSAIEGLTVVEPSLARFVVPITCVILTVLFLAQRFGTAAVGKLFGPVMVAWFATIGFLGAVHIADDPSVLGALSPHHAILYFAHHGWQGIFVLGAVVLAVTGGEALYADMGHFGIKPIRAVWLVLVMPALVLCYFGQGAMILANPALVTNPFFALVPAGPLTLGLVGLSSLATIIASQALISGAFSLTRQAMQLGFFPRVTIKHTASSVEGQIYIPQINALLAIACILLVLGFEHSERLASAYGIAVTGTMVLTSIVYFVVLRRTWNWPTWLATSVLALFLAFDVPFFVANTAKLFDGGWVPVLIGCGFVAAMLIWSKGRALISQRYAERLGSLAEVLPQIEKLCVARVPGTGVFMSSSATHVPPVLVHFVERSRTLQEQMILLNVVTDSVPTVPVSQRVESSSLGHGFYRVMVHYGFIDEPDVPAALALAAEQLGIVIEEATMTYFLGRESVLATRAGAMGAVAEGIFSLLSRNSVAADRHFKIPPDKAVEIGVQFDL
ncbi:MAG: potassium transporter Kup [Clostridia bacterium]|nr:potassium transporter Kup [Deltaproteobacteria bacterium]